MNWNKTKYTYTQCHRMIQSTCLFWTCYILCVIYSQADTFFSHHYPRPPFTPSHSIIKSLKNIFLSSDHTVQTFSPPPHSSPHPRSSFSFVLCFMLHYKCFYGVHFSCTETVLPFLYHHLIVPNQKLNNCISFIFAQIDKTENQIDHWSLTSTWERHFNFLLNLSKLYSFNVFKQKLCKIM